MDPSLLVEGGTDGLLRIAEAFKSADVVGIYLIAGTPPGAEEEERVIRLVSRKPDHQLAHELIAKFVQLQRDNALPRIDSTVRVHVVSPQDEEASRIIDYARRLGAPPLVIRDTMWDGLFIEYAAVALLPEREAAAA